MAAASLKLKFSTWLAAIKHLWEKIKTSHNPVWQVMKNTVTLYRSHDTSTLGAGLSYYMVFSIAPLLIIVVSVIGSIFGPKAAQGQIKSQIEGVLGASTAKQMQDMIQAAYQPGRNWIATTVSVILLIVGAIGVFDQLRTSFNTIWDIKPQAKKQVLRYFINRFFSFAMIVCLAFLLLVSLAIQAGLAFFLKFVSNNIPGLAKILITAFDLVLSFGLTYLLFIFMFKFMSDAKMKWKIAWPGALFTTFLFIIGKYLIGLYISKSNIANGYGAAGSLVVLLAWVYYSAQIVFFGAEFTRGLAIVRCIELDPNAAKTNEEAKTNAKQDVKDGK